MVEDDILDKPPIDIPMINQQEEYITMKRKDYDILKQAADLSKQAAELSLKSMIESEDQRIVLLAESMMHSWNILQTIITSKKNIQVNHNEIMKQS